MRPQCSIEGCDSPVQGIAHGWCRMHYARWWRHGDPLITRTSHRYVGNKVTYSGAHRRVRDRRGSASQFQCVKCQEQAKQWAYDHLDPAELVDARGYPYSGDPNHYVPMCTSCHIRADRSRQHEAEVLL